MSKQNSSGQISIIPKPEFSGDFGGDSLIKPPFRVTSAGTGRYNLPRIHQDSISLGFSKTNPRIWTKKHMGVSKFNGTPQIIHSSFLIGGLGPGGLDS